MALVSMLAGASVAGESITLELEIHPKLERERCAQLPDPEAIPDEADLPRLLSRGWVALKRHSFDVSREFWPCMQQVQVTFPRRELYLEFAREMSSCPQYPFWSGADHALQTRIFELGAERGDDELIRILLSKDPLCDSEMDAPLYAILRKNPRAFISVWAELDPAVQKRATQGQYDFNHPVEEQQFSPDTIASLPEPLRAHALRFNEFLRALSY